MLMVFATIASVFEAKGCYFAFLPLLKTIPSLTDDVIKQATKKREIHGLRKTLKKSFPRKKKCYSLVIGINLKILQT